MARQSQQAPWASLPLLIKPLMPSWALPSGPHPVLITSKRPHIQIPLTCELGDYVSHTGPVGGHGGTVNSGPAGSQALTIHRVALTQARSRSHHNFKHGW